MLAVAKRYLGSECAVCVGWRRRSCSYAANNAERIFSSIG
jgi:hypothetical protein